MPGPVWSKILLIFINFVKMLDSLHFIVEETEEKRCEVSYLNQRLHCKKKKKVTGPRFNIKHLPGSVVTGTYALLMVKSNYTVSPGQFA